MSGGGLGQSQFGTNWGNYIGANPGASNSYGVLNTNTGGLGGAPNSAKAGGGINMGALGGLAGALGGGGQQQQPQASPDASAPAGAAFAPIHRGRGGQLRRFGGPIVPVQLAMGIFDVLRRG